MGVNPMGMPGVMGVNPNVEGQNYINYDMKSGKNSGNEDPNSYYGNYGGYYKQG